MQIAKERIEYESHEQKYNRIASTNDRCLKYLILNEQISGRYIAGNHSM
jgi:hypothetical protein